jgi:predicted O-methyltransferase YrrM
MNLEEIAKLTGDEPYHAQQKWTELRDFLEFMKPRKPKNILEIGVYKGGTIMAWTHIASDNAQILGVDLHGGEFGGGFDHDEAEAIINLERANQTIYLMDMDSHKKLSVELIKRHSPFDFIFIDADHTYEGVKKDYENYYPMLVKDGVMAFHDVAEMKQVDYPDVWVHRLWKEIKDKHESYEFIDLDFPTDHGIWGGIGAIIK